MLIQFININTYEQVLQIVCFSSSKKSFFFFFISNVKEKIVQFNIKENQRTKSEN